MFCSCLKPQKKVEEEEAALPALLTSEETSGKIDEPKWDPVLIKTDDKITIKYSVADGPQKQEEFDFLFVACNPNQLNMGLTANEKKVFSHENTKVSVIQTTLFKFPVNVTEESKLWPAILFAPGVNSRLDGSVYGYRSETRKTLNSQPCDAAYEFVTVYQVVEPDFVGKKPDDFPEEVLNAMLEKDLQDSTWFPYEYSRGEVMKTYRTLYFQRFQHKSLADGVADPWDTLSLQGENKTIYVHASACFESVLNVYQNFNLIRDSKRDAFPATSSKVAIIGAGPSGLLAARQLQNMGYQSITMFESLTNQDDPNVGMVAGKTQTWVEESAGSGHTTCELGTCYMSPEYDKMIEDLQDESKGGNIFDGNTRIALASPPSDKERVARFRQILTAGQFSPTGPVMKLFGAEGTFWEKSPQKSGDFPTTLEYTIYYRLKTLEETVSANGKSVAGLQQAWASSTRTFAMAGLRYCYLHLYYFKVRGKQWPIPTTRVNRKLLNQTIYQFLDEYKIKALIGLLQYAYSVQGYGSVNEDTTEDALYLLIWITPAAFYGFCDKETQEASLALFEEVADESDETWNTLGKVLRASVQGEAMVTAWSEGWGKAWLNQKAYFAKDPKKTVQIEYGAKISEVVRASLGKSA